MPITLSSSTFILLCNLSRSLQSSKQKQCCPFKASTQTAAAAAAVVWLVNDTLVVAGRLFLGPVSAFCSPCWGQSLWAVSSSVIMQSARTVMPHFLSTLINHLERNNCSSAPFSSATHHCEFLSAVTPAVCRRTGANFTLSNWPHSLAATSAEEALPASSSSASAPTAPTAAALCELIC